MKCVICHGDDIRMASVTEEVARDSDIVLVPIETLVCSNCGERYYDRKTMRYLEEIRQRIINRNVALSEVGRILVCESVS